MLVLLIGTSCDNQPDHYLQSLKNYQEELYFKDKEIARMDSLINAYEEYYISTEELLDSLGIFNNHPILKTDAGAQYLGDKYLLDNLYNSTVQCK